MAGRVAEHLGCEVIVATGDGDLLAARVARERSPGCLGVLVHDSDYFFFPDMEGLDFYSCQSRELYEPGRPLRATAYHPARVSAALGLSHSSMPLLASLIGTDYVSREDLKGFQSRVPLSATFLALVCWSMTVFYRSGKVAGSTPQSTSPSWPTASPGWRGGTRTWRPWPGGSWPTPASPTWPTR